MKSISLVLLLFSFLSLIHPAQAEFTTEERCITYRLFDLNDTTVNLRQSPGGKVIAAVRNETVVVEDFGADEPSTGNWLAVRHEGRTLYVSTQLAYRFIQLVLDPKDRSVNLRRSPNGAVVRTVINNTEVVLLEPGRQWVKVRLENGQEGYVFKDLLRLPSCW